ncbi:MAG: hypothetical protein ABW076_16480 [Candidatus Thiodiazotropha sp.]
MAIEWQTLDQEEQLKLREAYGHYLDTLPPTCSLDMKVARFTEWLRRQGIAFEMEDPVRN